MKKELWFLTIASLAVILIVHIVATLGNPSHGAGPQPSSSGGGTGA